MTSRPVSSPLVALAALALAVPAYAQQAAQGSPPGSSSTSSSTSTSSSSETSSSSPSETPASSGLTPEQQAEIEKALQQDAAAQAKSQGASTAHTAMTSPAPGPVGFALQSLNPDISFIADVALAAFSGDPANIPTLQAGGHDPQKTGFNLQALELSVGKAVDPYFRFDANIVFASDGVEIEEAYATTLALPYGLQARAGKFLTRFGRLNASHPHTWDFADQPFMLSRIFGGEGNRGLGVEVSWLAPLPWYAELVGSVTDAQEEGATRSFISKDVTPDFQVRRITDFDDTLALKQFFALSDDWSLMWGLSFATGPNGQGLTTNTFSQIYGTDLYVKYRPLSGGDFTIVSLQAEGYYRVRQLQDDALNDFGGYAYLFWRFQPTWGAALRYEYGSPTTNRQGAVADDYLDHGQWTASRHRVSANLTWWPTEFSRLRLQGNVDFPRWLAQPVYGAFLTAEFSVGAHGAHKF